jgi:hypothetical protein
MRFGAKRGEFATAPSLAHRWAGAYIMRWSNARARSMTCN